MGLSCIVAGGGRRVEGHVSSMGITSRSVLVPAHGAGAIPALVTEPPSGTGPGMLVVHEIFGVTDHVRSRAETLARLGYVAIVPDLYWRLARGVVIDEAAEDAVERGLEYRRRLDFTVAVDDAVTTFEHLRSLPAAYRRSGVLGFGLGAGIAFGVAAHAGPAAAVLYYGSDIAAHIDRAPDVRCPVLFHWGGDDDLVPEPTRHAVAAAFAHRGDVETHVHPGASHTFDNARSPDLSRPEQAARAWARTEEFLTRTLPVGHH